MKRLSITLTLILLITSLSIYLLGYHGDRSFESTEELPPPASVIKNARDLIGTPYDPFMGMYGNIGATAGFIVCSDVPNIAYGLSGYSLQKMLEIDFANNPAAYNSANGNKPGNPYFHRRARNLHAYFAANGKALPSTAAPAVGDLAFYRGNPNGYISHVALVTETNPNGYRVMESAPETLLAQEVSGESPLERGWLLVGFGRMYPPIHKNSLKANGTNSPLP